jgi:hypothetical protein
MLRKFDTTKGTHKNKGKKRTNICKSKTLIFYTPPFGQNIQISYFAKK